jgi:hypothetical protein
MPDDLRLRDEVAAQLDALLALPEWDALLDELAASGRVNTLLDRVLGDGHPVLPAELAALVHIESVAFIDELRTECLSRGENVVIEGTLSWPPAAQRLLRELVQRAYRDVTILDIEVPRQVAHEQARARWWRGRLGAVAGHGHGGRFVTASAIDHAFPSAEHSVCMDNVRAAFDSEPALDLPAIRLQVLDWTGAAPRVELHERRAGVLQPQR